MSTHVATTYRPGGRVLGGLGWRAALVVAAALAAALELTAWLRAPLAVAAAVVTIAFVVQRYRRRGLVHVLLVAVGSGVVALALIGLLLNVLPVGLAPAGWGVAVGLLELAVLVALAFLRPPAPRRADAVRVSPASLGWAAAIAVVLGGALLWSTASFRATHVEPLAVAAEQDGSSFAVTVSAGSTEGPYRLDLVTADGRTTVARGLRVTADRDATAVVEVPAGTRGLLQLVPAAGGTAVRQLILDDSASSGSGS